MRQRKVKLFARDEKLRQKNPLMFSIYGTVVYAPITKSTLKTKIFL